LDYVITENQDNGGHSIIENNTAIMGWSGDKQ